MINAKCVAKSATAGSPWNTAPKAANPAAAIPPAQNTTNASVATYVLQSDGNLMEVKQPAFRPETFAIWHSYRKTTLSRPNFSGNWLSTNKPIWPTTKPFYEQLNLIQQGDTISGEWIRGRLSSLEQNSEISRIHAKGQVRGQIHNGRLTLEYCSEAGKFSPYKPCPQYQHFNSYYVMQSDGTLEKLILTGTHPYTYEFGYSFHKQ